MWVAIAQSPSSPPGIFASMLSHQGSDVSLGPSLLGDRQGERRLGAIELLEVPQGKHLAVDRIEAVQRLLDPQEPLGALRGLRGRSLPSQQHRRQRGRTGLRQRLAVERLGPRAIRVPRWCLWSVVIRSPTTRHNQRKGGNFGSRRGVRPLRRTSRSVLDDYVGASSRDRSRGSRRRSTIRSRQTPVPVQAEQRGRSPAWRRLDETDGLARTVVHQESSHTLLPHGGADSGQGQL